VYLEFPLQIVTTMLQTNKSFASNLFSTSFCLFGYLFVYSNICSMLHFNVWSVSLHVYLCVYVLLFCFVCVARNSVKKITLMWNMQNWFFYEKIMLRFMKVTIFFNELRKRRWYSIVFFLQLETWRILWKCIASDGKCVTCLLLFCVL
jgi:hypothetical protein